MSRVGITLAVAFLGLVTSGSGLKDSGNGVYWLEKKGDTINVPASAYEELRIFCHSGDIVVLAEDVSFDH